MLHHTTLLSTIIMGLVLAFVFGTIANRLKLSPIVGYLLAGVVIGPFTPGYVADQGLATQLAELGAMACPMRLRDYDVPRNELPALAEKIAVRPGAKANPRPAPPEAIAALLQEAW